MPMRAGDGYLDVDNVANAIMYAHDNGAKVISMSFYTEEYPAISQAINYAHDNGTTIFASTGNENIQNIHYPASLEKCIAVGAHSPCNERKSNTSCDGEQSWGSNYGTELDFLAPTLVLTTDLYPDGGGRIYNEFSGTSASCPHAASVAGLMLSVNPELTPDQIREIMQNTSVDLDPNGGLGSDGWDIYTGYGRINSYAAVNYANLAEFGCTDPFAINYDPDANSDDGSCECGILGDTNNDGYVDVLDLVILTDFVMGFEQPTPCQEWAGDVNSDTFLTILDQVRLVEYIMTGEWPLGRTFAHSDINNYLYISEGKSLHRDGGQYVILSINSEEPVRALHFELSSLVQEVEVITISEEIYYMTLVSEIYSGGIEIVIYGQEGQSIPPGEYDICEIQIEENSPRMLDEQGILFQGVFVNDQRELLQLSFHRGKNQLIPEQFTLYSAYPNPFNSATSIKFGLPIEGTISLSIFDINGREFELLQNEIYSSGVHEINWFPDGFSSGIYFVKVKYNNTTLTQKLMLLK